MVKGKGYYNIGEYIYVTRANVYTDGSMHFILVGGILYPVDKTVALFTPSNTLMIFRAEKSWSKDSGVMLGLKKVGEYHHSKSTPVGVLLGPNVFITLPDGMQPQAEAI